MVNNWTTENEVYCQRLGEQSSVFNWMHIQSEDLYRRRYSILSFILLGLSVSAAAIGVVDSFYSSNYGKIINRILNILVAALVKYYTSCKEKDLIEIHKKIQLEYHTLHDKIQFVLSSNQSSRVDAIEFLEEVRQQYNYLLQTSPTVPKEVIVQFNREYKLNNIYKPIIAGELDRISISREEGTIRTDNVPPQWIRKNGDPQASWITKMKKRLDSKEIRPNTINFAYHSTSDSSISDKATCDNTDANNVRADDTHVTIEIPSRVTKK